MSRKRIELEGRHVTYEDDWSVEENHDVIQMTLPGQSYLKETMHKVSTTQVTGEALKKVALGGKGGMGSQGDAREQDKQVLSTARVMVLSDPSQEVFDHNAALDRVAVKFNENLPTEYLHSSWGVEGMPEYMGEDLGKTTVTYINNKDEEVTQEIDRYKTSIQYIDKENIEKYSRMIYCPSRILGEKKVKGWIELTKSFGRDYDEFSHSDTWDAADSMAMMEKMYSEWDANIEFATQLGTAIDSPCPITLKQLTVARERYDETCNYKGAWKYCRDEFDYEDGQWIRNIKTKARRYMLHIVNTLNQDEKRRHDLYLYTGPQMDEWIKEVGGYLNQWTEDLGNGLTKKHSVVAVPVRPVDKSDWTKKQKKRMKRAGIQQLSEETSHNHNITAYEIMTKYYNETKSEKWLNKKFRKLSRKDCAQYLMWELSQGRDPKEDTDYWVNKSYKVIKIDYPTIISEVIKAYLWRQKVKQHEWMERFRSQHVMMIQNLDKKDIEWAYKQEKTVKGKSVFAKGSVKKGEDNINRQFTKRLNRR